MSVCVYTSLWLIYRRGQAEGRDLTSIPSLPQCSSTSLLYPQRIHDAHYTFALLIQNVYIEAEAQYILPWHTVVCAMCRASHLEQEI